MGHAVELRFHDSFAGLNNQKYDIKLNRGVFRRMQQSLSEGELTNERLFPPSVVHILGRMPPSPQALKTLEPGFNRDVIKNADQKLSVGSIIGQSAGSPPFIVFGP